MCSLAALDAVAADGEGTAEGILPPSVARALARSQVPLGALAIEVREIDAPAPVLSLNARQPMNPASVFKLLTTAAALDRLGPDFTWNTPVGATGPVRGDVLQGSLVIRGSGDPTLVIERLWLLLRRIRAFGIREIQGDIVLDASAFDPPARSPADFDGAPERPYNVLPDALLLNQGVVVLRIVPRPDEGLARLDAEPALEGVTVDAGVPLVDGPCGDWREGLKRVPSDPTGWRFAGVYPAACGEQSWPLAYADPPSFGPRLVAALWRELGGSVRGSVRRGMVPAGTAPLFEWTSPPLDQVVRDIDKFSNNVMAEQLFLTLALQSSGRTHVGTDDAHAALRDWLRTRLGDGAADSTVIVNGSGLARETRVSAETLGRLLQWVADQAFAPELWASLPVDGGYGTLRRHAAAAGRAHLKTGSMRDVAARAGMVLADDGRRYLLVALVNDPHADAAQPVFDALVDWTRRGAPSSRTPQSRTPQK